MALTMKNRNAFSHQWMGNKDNIITTTSSNDDDNNNNKTCDNFICFSWSTADRVCTRSGSFCLTVQESHCYEAFHKVCQTELERYRARLRL